MSVTGRHYIRTKEGRLFCIEPIDNTEGKGSESWGDIDPATKNLTGNYGKKYIGSIHENESIITKENGFKNITMTNGNPYDIINKLTEND